MGCKNTGSFVFLPLEFAVHSLIIIGEAREAAPTHPSEHTAIASHVREVKALMNKRRKKIKDLVDMLEEPEESAYVGADYDDYEAELEREREEASEEYEEGEEEELEP